MRHKMMTPVLALALAGSAALAADYAEPEFIFKVRTVFRLLSPDAYIRVHAVDDPKIDGVTCHVAVPEIGGWKGWAGLAEERSDVSLACRQVGPIRFKAKFAQGEAFYEERRSFLFKKLHLVRACDRKRNVLVYLTYSDKLIEGSPKNSISTVPITPWGNEPPPRCADWLKD